jgi:hypothetical protein
MALDLYIINEYGLDKCVPNTVYNHHSPTQVKVQPKLGTKPFLGK